MSRARISRHGELRMLPITAHLQTLFEAGLHNQAISKHTHGLYKKWLPYYLDSFTSITCHMHTATAWFPFSTNYRKRSKPKPNKRRHKQSRCMTSLFTPGMLAPMSFQPQKTVLRRRLLMHRLILPCRPPSRIETI